MACFTMLGEDGSSSLSEHELAHPWRWDAWINTGAFPYNINY